MSLFPAHDLQAAIDEYVAATIEEADTAADWDRVFPGPKQRAARSRLDRAYQRLYVMSEVGRSRVFAAMEGLPDER